MADGTKITMPSGWEISHEGTSKQGLMVVDWGAVNRAGKRRRDDGDIEGWGRLFSKECGGLEG